MAWLTLDELMLAQLITFFFSKELLISLLNKSVNNKFCFIPSWRVHSKCTSLPELKLNDFEPPSCSLRYVFLPSYPLRNSFDDKPSRVMPPSLAWWQFLRVQGQRYGWGKPLACSIMCSGPALSMQLIGHMASSVQVGIFPRAPLVPG